MGAARAQPAENWPWWTEVKAKVKAFSEEFTPREKSLFQEKGARHVCVHVCLLGSTRAQRRVPGGARCGVAGREHRCLGDLRKLADKSNVFLWPNFFLHFKKEKKNVYCKPQCLVNPPRPKLSTCALGQHEGHGCPAKTPLDRGSGGDAVGCLLH